jgi:hypothetical protein
MKRLAAAEAPGAPAPKQVVRRPIPWLGPGLPPMPWLAPALRLNENMKQEKEVAAETATVPRPWEVAEETTTKEEAEETTTKEEAEEPWFNPYASYSGMHPKDLAMLLKAVAELQKPLENL